MIKYIKNSVIILIVIALIIPFTYVYAIGSEDNKEKMFFEISKLEISKEEKIELMLNIDKITYTKSIFELNSSENIEDIEVDNELEMEKQHNEIVIELDKENTTLNLITFYYDVPEQKQVGDTIKFSATIINAENIEEKESIELEVKIIEEPEKEDTKNESEKEESKNETEKEDSKQEEKEEPKDNTKTEKIEDAKSEDSSKDNQKDTTNLQEKNTTQNNTSTQSSKSGTTSSSSTKSTSSSTSNTQNVVTYKGSDNNYLQKLEIEGYSLNKDFVKENSTYFVKIGDENIQSLNVTAIAEESTSKVCIYGNESLTDNTNKILISVTAENGNVRNYRIYITKNV